MSWFTKPDHSAVAIASLTAEMSRVRCDLAHERDELVKAREGLTRMIGLYEAEKARSEQLVGELRGEIEKTTRLETEVATAIVERDDAQRHAGWRRGKLVLVHGRAQTPGPLAK